MYKKIYKQIKKYNKIVLARHIGPDPDALGSTLGLKEAILNTFPNKEVYVVGDTHSRVFDFIESTKEIKKELDGDDFDLAISLDCASKQRLYDPKKKIGIENYDNNFMNYE